MNLIFNYRLRIKYDKKKIMFRAINNSLYLPGEFESLLNRRNVNNSEELAKFIRLDPKEFLSVLKHDFGIKESENELNRLLKKIGETPDIKIDEKLNMLDFLT